MCGILFSLKKHILNSWPKLCYLPPWEIINKLFNFLAILQSKQCTCPDEGYRARNY